jgi:hypothetical protein
VAAPLSLVMARLRPGHPRLPCRFASKGVDARHKAGHDGFPGRAWQYRAMLERGEANRGRYEHSEESDREQRQRLCRFGLCQSGRIASQGEAGSRDPCHHQAPQAHADEGRRRARAQAAGCFRACHRPGRQILDRWSGSMPGSVGLQGGCRRAAEAATNIFARDCGVGVDGIAKGVTRRLVVAERRITLR